MAFPCTTPLFAKGYHEPDQTTGTNQPCMHRTVGLYVCWLSASRGHRRLDDTDLQHEPHEMAATLPQRAQRLNVIVAQVEVDQAAAVVQVADDVDVVVGQVHGVQPRQQVQGGVHVLKAVLLATEAGQLRPH